MGQPTLALVRGRPHHRIDGAPPLDFVEPHLRGEFVIPPHVRSGRALQA